MVEIEEANKANLHWSEAVEIEYDEVAIEEAGTGWGAVILYYLILLIFVRCCRRSVNLPSAWENWRNISRKWRRAVSTSSCSPWKGTRRTMRPTISLLTVRGWRILSKSTRFSLHPCIPSPWIIAKRREGELSTSKMSNCSIGLTLPFRKTTIPFLQRRVGRGSIQFVRERRKKAE